MFNILQILILLIKKASFVPFFASVVFTLSTIVAKDLFTILDEVNDESAVLREAIVCHRLGQGML